MWGKRSFARRFERIFHQKSKNLATGFLHVNRKAISLAVFLFIIPFLCYPIFLFCHLVTLCFNIHAPLFRLFRELLELLIRKLSQRFNALSQKLFVVVFW